ncbi:hypothetical protein C0991_003213 [Blastosporella zonata]|nr:hypothetical protein C0991_003213 [Blastosporella zonata]
MLKSKLSSLTESARRQKEVDVSKAAEEKRLDHEIALLKDKLEEQEEQHLNKTKALNTRIQRLQDDKAILKEEATHLAGQHELRKLKKRMEVTERENARLQTKLQMQSERAEQHRMHKEREEAKMDEAAEGKSRENEAKTRAKQEEERSRKEQEAQRLDELRVEQEREKTQRRLCNWWTATQDDPDKWKRALVSVMDEGLRKQLAEKYNSQSLSHKSATEPKPSQHIRKAPEGSTHKGKAKVSAKKVSYAESSLGDNTGEKLVVTPAWSLIYLVLVDDRMWVDIYEPTTEAEIAVHKRKVEDVRRWFHEAFEGGPSGHLKKYRVSSFRKVSQPRLISGTENTCIDWPSWYSKNDYNVFNAASSSSEFYAPTGEALFAKFEAFLNRASSCHNLFATAASNTTSAPSQSSSSSGPIVKRHIILLEDLPNLLHPTTQSQFHSALQALVTLPLSNPPVPVVLIVSDVGVRGEVADERMTRGGGWGKAKEGVVDIRTVLPRDLLGGPYVTQIGFNPIAPTLLLKALQALVHTHFSTPSRSAPSRELLDAIIESSNGDIRSAIMALQFACVVEMNRKNRKKKGGEKGKTVMLESVTRREQSLVLFHLLGKVLLFSAGKNDPPSSSASAKDVEKEKASDAQLKDPPKPSPDFQEHDRRASRINVDSLYADSPIDSSLFSLYIHQNYPQFCDGIEQCDGIADWLSWVDSSGGDVWYQANPHQFHLLTLGTIHSLPSPVARRSQKITKPLFFECLQREKNAWEGVRDARGWALGDGKSQAAGWSHSQVAVELGGVLKARDQTTTGSLPRPPHSHKLFSSLKFSLGAPFGVVQSLDEKEVDQSRIDGDDGGLRPSLQDIETAGGWLDGDDIEDF